MTSQNMKQKIYLFLLLRRSVRLLFFSLAAFYIIILFIYDNYQEHSENDQIWSKDQINTYDNRNMITLNFPSL